MQVKRLSALIPPAFYAVHADMKRQRHAEIWLSGGRGSGKSSFASIEILLGMLRNPSVNATVYRKVGATLRESVYGQMIWAIERLGLERYFKCRLAPLELEYLPTGQRVLFRGADDPMKSKSIKLTKGYFKYLWLEELSEFRGMEDVRTIKQSVFRGVNRAITFYSYNPPCTAANWVNAEALKPREDRLVHHSTYLDVLAEHPEWIADAFIAEAEAVKTTNERAYRNEYLGEVTGTGGQVFDNLELREITDAEIDALGTFYNGLDFGFAVDPDAFSRWAYDRRERKLYAISEYYGSHTSIDLLAEKVFALAGREIVRCDCADPRMIAELKRRGINAIGVKKGPGSVEHGMRWLTDQGAIVVDPKRTPNIAREFAAYEYEMDKNGAFIAEYPDRGNHTIDAARYAMEPLIGKKKLQTMSKARLGL